MKCCRQRRQLQCRHWGSSRRIQPERRSRTYSGAEQSQGLKRKAMERFVALPPGRVMTGA
jgi:hypothetical protein